MQDKPPTVIESPISHPLNTFHMELLPFACEYAQTALSVWERHFPADMRPRMALATIGTDGDLQKAAITAYDAGMLAYAAKRKTAGDAAMSAYRAAIAHLPANAKRHKDAAKAIGFACRAIDAHISEF